MTNEGGEDLDDRHAPQPAHPWIEGAWSEAAGAVQAEDDADVRLEARGLMVAEMTDVAFAERSAACAVGQSVRLLIRGGARVEGRIDLVGADHLVLVGSTRLVIPQHAVAAVWSLPRVLHYDGPLRPPPWRSTLRTFLGIGIVATTHGIGLVGRLIWVGDDHISLEHEAGEVTIPWPAVDSLTVPGPLTMDDVPAG